MSAAKSSGQFRRLASLRRASRAGHSATRYNQAPTDDAIPHSGGMLSAIGIWEIGIKWQRKKLDLGGLDLREYVRRVQSIAGLEIVPVSGDLWVENIMLEWAHRDPADRTIVATALMRDLPVVTCDQHITGFYSRVIW